MKRIFFIILFILLFSNAVYAEEYDYEPGLLFGKPFYNPETMTTYHLMTDGKHSTRDRLEPHGSITHHIVELDRVYDIELFYIRFHNTLSFYVNFYDINDKKIAVVDGRGLKINIDNYIETKVQGVKKIELVVEQGNYLYVHSIEVYGMEREWLLPPYNLYVTDITNTEALLTWESVVGDLFNIYLNEKQIANVLGKQFKLTELESGKSYTVRVSALINGIESKLSEPYIFHTLTDEEWYEHPNNPQNHIPDVRNLTSKPSNSSIKLIWENPDFENFSHVNIYRKELYRNKKSAIEEFFLGKAVLANEEYVKIFSTNGTWWEDHTVEKHHSYEYLVKVEDINQRESKGVKIIATAETPPPQPPKDIRTEHGVDDNGQYLLIEWEPVEGAIAYEIIIDGAPPVVVNHPTTSYKHYHDGSKSNFDVQIVVVGEDGLRSPPKRPPVFRDVDWDISVGELIKNTLDYIMLFKGFVLLGIILILAPMIVAFFKYVMRNRRQTKGVIF